MNLETYLPVLLFILVGLAVGVVLKHWAICLDLSGPMRLKIPPMNVDLMRLKMHA